MMPIATAHEITSPTICMAVLFPNPKTAKALGHNHCFPPMWRCRLGGSPHDMPQGRYSPALRRDAGVADAMYRAESRLGHRVRGGLARPAAGPLLLTPFW